MASIFGRAIIVTKTNKSGGSLAKGDVVVIDSSNDNAVTTTTTAATTVTVGVVVEENGIANNASGRVQFGGHVGLITPNASVTRGHYGATHTVAKQCTDAGASRVVGTFCVFTTGGTTPEADLFTQPDASSATGNMATDALWDAAGDLAVGTGANTGAKLTIGASGKVPTSNGTTLAYAFPPGYEFDYVETTSITTVNATTEGGANTIVTGNSVAYDGATKVNIEVGLYMYGPASANVDIVIVLIEDSTVLGELGRFRSESANRFEANVTLHRYKTPSNASHAYVVKAYVGSGSGGAGGLGGGSGTTLPGYIRVTKA